MYKEFYSSLASRIEETRKKLGRPLTLTEKILGSHLVDPGNQDWSRGASQLLLKPDRVAMQDVTGQMAILQFMQSGRQKVSLPATVHCDHLIRAKSGVESDMQMAIKENKEVFDFLSSSCKKFGIGFWKPGSGIIHQVVLENYAFPGGLMIGSDSHTPNAGGLCMLAVGVGGMDVSEVMAGLPWEILCPKVIGVRLKGRLGKWSSPKDIIIKLCGILSVKGGTNSIIEYFGEGTESISATGKATVTNMGAEVGATTSVFPYDKKTYDYLTATNREEIAKFAEENKEHLKADKETEENPANYYDRVIEIDLDNLEPQICGPFTPDKTYSLSEFKEVCKKENYPLDIKACLIGSCTNSSYEDIGRAASIARQALKQNLRVKTKFFITPGSNTVFETVKKAGFIKPLEEIGGVILSNACGPCIGQWDRSDIKKGEKNTIVNSFNRNFKGRNDGNPDTFAFISSPEIVTAFALTGKLNFNPLTDTIDSNGDQVTLEPPQSDELPQGGLTKERYGYEEPSDQPEQIEVKVDPNSERLQILEPFKPWDGNDFEKLPILLKATGKTTTDHISPAGLWLKYRGHLDKISDNMFLGAKNQFTEKQGTGINVITKEKEINLSKLARQYKAKGIKSVVIGDDNYGEGSSREHAAMSPRYLNVAAVIVKSFARIHETNLKKQGILALTFSTPEDYDKFGAFDRVSITNLKGFAPGKQITVIIHKESGEEIKIKCNHSYTERQVEWFKAGSALNTLK